MREPSRRAADVVHLLDRVLEVSATAGRDGTAIEARLVRALAVDAEGAEREAVDDLAAALIAAVPVGYRRLFLDEGTPLESLLRAVSTPTPGQRGGGVRRPRAGSGAGNGRRPTPGGTGRVAPGGGEGLSDRELEVLRLLATDLTGPEIAARLFVSVNTLRTHTKHIFTKLEVNTRRAAVSRAGELHLL